jgi:hypothetical protein
MRTNVREFVAVDPNGVSETSAPSGPDAYVVVGFGEVEGSLRPTEITYVFDRPLALSICADDVDHTVGCVVLAVKWPQTAMGPINVSLVAKSGNVPLDWERVDEETISRYLD